MRKWKSKQAKALYDAYPKHVNNVRAEARIIALLKSGEIEYDVFMARVQAQRELWKHGIGVPKGLEFCPAMDQWIVKGGYENDDVLAECSPKNRLKVMFEAWHKTTRGNVLSGMDYHRSRFVWLHLRKLDRAIPGDLHLEAGDEYQWSVQRYGSIFAGEASDDIMSAIERLK